MLRLLATPRDMMHASVYAGESNNCHVDPEWAGLNLPNLRTDIVEDAPLYTAHQPIHFQKMTFRKGTNYRGNLLLFCSARTRTHEQCLVTYTLLLASSSGAGADLFPATCDLNIMSLAKTMGGDTKNTPD